MLHLLGVVGCYTLGVLLMLHFRTRCTLMLHFRTRCTLMLHFRTRCTLMLHFRTRCTLMLHFSCYWMVLLMFIALFNRCVKNNSFFVVDSIIYNHCNVLHLCCSIMICHVVDDIHATLYLLNVNHSYEQLLCCKLLLYFYKLI